LVTIGGTKFTKATAVKFGSTTATGFTVNSKTSITAVSPPVAAAGKVDVTVTTPQGTSPISPTDTFEFTPTVTGVSPNAGPPAGGTPVTITGSGFAVGASATRITFGNIETETETEAVGVNCTTTTECTATTPELSPEEESTVDVRATVNNAVSPQTPADQFHYHGLWLIAERHRLPVGATVRLRMRVSTKFNQCTAFLFGRIAVNGEETDEIDTGVEQSGCNASEWSGELSGFFALRLSEAGSATVEGPMGVTTLEACDYEGNKLSGGFEIFGFPFVTGIGGTFTLVAEKEPAECTKTESVFMNLESQFFTTEVVG
jgi:hypothetical protein